MFLENFSDQEREKCELLTLEDLVQNIYEFLVLDEFFDGEN